MVEWIVDTVAAAGYLGVALLMALENVFPPIPSELIMPLAGFAAARGDLNPVLVVVAGTVGSVAGTLPWYYGARRLGRERLRDLIRRHGRWFAVATGDLDKAADFLKRHGRSALFFGRLVPAVRSLISIPAGLAEVPLGRYLLYSAAGSAVWSAALTAAGYLLKSQYEQVADVIDPVAKVVVVGAVLWYFWRVYRCGRSDACGGDREPDRQRG